MDDRSLAIDQLKKDKEKTDDQILTDVYEELLKTDRQLPSKVTNNEIYNDLENLKHGLKRLSGFFYNQSRSSSKLVQIGIIISIFTLIFTLTNVFPVIYIYKNLDNPIIFVFLGIVLLLIASFVGIIRSFLNSNVIRSLLIVSGLSFIGFLLIGLALFSSFIE